MSSFWDQRFAQHDYVYGTEPNPFFRQQLDLQVPAVLLLPGEGEGRNAVYAARCGWEVFAFDSSVVGRSKALKLAEQHQVDISYEISTYQDYDVIPGMLFDCIALIYTHMPVEMRRSFHQNCIDFLRPGGTIILEAFSKEQYGKSSGGPKDLDMLYSQDDLRIDFKVLSKFHVEQMEIEKKEGLYHNGLSSVIRLTGIK